MLESVNLSLASACGANCIFCPANRGKRITAKLMPFPVLKKVVDELSSSSFKKKHNVLRIEIGENGDAFLNRDIIKILLYIKKKLPQNCGNFLSIDLINF
jgi:MoaA/NifB/PqqE/SkfB family radical SAM enzyme